MPDHLQLLVKPAGADCNQSCVYCFYRRVRGELYPGENPPRMMDATLEAMIRRFLRLRQPQSVFCWQGGEPTLAGLDFFRRAVALMQQHGRGGQSVSNALQTNGLLLDDEWCQFLENFRFLVGLSLDGPPELHDLYRKTPGRDGSHQDVMRAMGHLRENHVEFNVLSVVNDATARHAKTLYNYFRELGVSHMQFIPCVETGTDGIPAPFSVSAEAYGDFLCELFDCWRADVPAVSERLFDALLARELTGRSGLCTLDGLCGDYLVVEHNGDVYPCDFFVSEEWRLGNINQTPYEKLLERGRMRQFRAARRRLPDECASCRWRDLCRGGCLKDRSRAGGRFDQPTFFCKAFQRLFAHAENPLKELAAAMRGRLKCGQ